MFTSSYRNWSLIIRPASFIDPVIPELIVTTLTTMAWSIFMFAVSFAYLMLSTDFQYHLVPLGSFYFSSIHIISGFYDDMGKSLSD